MLCAADTQPLQVAVSHAPELIVVLDHSALTIPLKEHLKTLLVTPGTIVRVSQAIGYVQDRPIFISHPSGGPHIALVAIGESTLHTNNRHLHRLESGDEVYQVYVVAPHIDKRVRLVAREPVLEIG